MITQFNIYGVQKTTEAYCLNAALSLAEGVHWSLHTPELLLVQHSSIVDLLIPHLLPAYIAIAASVLYKQAVSQHGTTHKCVYETQEYSNAQAWQTSKSAKCRSRKQLNVSIM